MRTIDIKAGDRMCIISQFSNSLSQTYKFSASPKDEGTALSGKVEVKGSNFLFPKPPIVQELQSENEVAKRMWDTIYTVYVTPDVDIRLTLQSGNSNALWVYLIIILIIVAVASALMF